MPNTRAQKSLSITDPTEKLPSAKTHLTEEQVECLSRCARGISLRFDRLEIVDALVDGGYAEKGVAGVVRVTAKGQDYLSSLAS